MANKMYYSEEETAAKLRIAVEQLTNLAREGKLQQYQDGAKKVYRADEVDKLASTLAADDTGEIELAPADTASGDAISLSEAEIGEDASKEDTVITADGISIFDDEDFEAADPMAKTQIAPSLEEQISGEGAGSGSGLLDLTRESDDTSLGAEVLDHIDMESGVGPGLTDEVPAVAYTPVPEQATVQPLAVPVLEAVDPTSGLFSGAIIACAAVALLLSVVMASAMMERASAFVETLKNQMPIVVGVVVVVMIVGGIVGFLLGKSAATRQQALQKLNG